MAPSPADPLTSLLANGCPQAFAALYDRLAPEYEELHRRLAPVNEVLATVERPARG